MIKEAGLKGLQIFAVIVLLAFIGTLLIPREKEVRSGTVSSVNIENHYVIVKTDEGSSEKAFFKVAKGVYEEGDSVEIYRNVSDSKLGLKMASSTFLVVQE